MPESEQRRQWTTDDIYEALKNRDRDKYPIASAGQIAEFVGCSKPTVHDRLKELEDSGKVNSTKINRGKAFWLVGEKVQYHEEAGSNQSLSAGGEDENQGKEEEIIGDGEGIIHQFLQASVFIGFLGGIAGLALPLIAFVVDILSPQIFGPKVVETVQQAAVHHFPDYAILWFLIAIAAEASLSVDMTRRVELKIAEFRRSL